MNLFLLSLQPGPTTTQLLSELSGHLTVSMAIVGMLLFVHFRQKRK